MAPRWHRLYAASEWTRTTSKVLTTLVGCTVVLSLFLLGYTRQTHRVTPNSDRTVATQTVGTEQRITVVFVGSATCGPCKRPELPRAIAELASRARDVAAANDYAFTAVGISVDDDWRSGVSFLETISKFDEIVSGSGWANLGGQYIGGLSAPRATPQVIVTATSAGQGEIVLARMLGVTQITQWSRWPSLGLPIDPEAAFE